RAVMAFQGWVGFTRDGIAGALTQARLKLSVTPKPWSGTRKYRHIEIHKGKQIMIMVGAEGRVQRTIHVSTAGPGHVTPTGHWKVYSKSLMSWIVRCTRPDRKSTRLNSSHVEDSYAVFCLKKKSEAKGIS